MIKRIIDISEQAYLHLRHEQLLIERDKKIIGQVPVEDLGMVIVQHPAIVISQGLIIACQRHGVAGVL